MTTAGNVTRGRLVLSPLHTSDRGKYTCTGGISVDSCCVAVAVNSSSSIEINVTSSKCCQCSAFFMCVVSSQSLHQM